MAKKNKLITENLRAYIENPLPNFIETPTLLNINYTIISEVKNIKTISYKNTLNLSENNASRCSEVI